MTGRNGFGVPREDLASRNAMLRDQIDGMLSDLRRRTEEIQQKQADAARQTFEVTSEDGVITVRVDATGTVQELLLSPKAFERTSPDKLARAITSVIREASGTAQRRLHDEFAPMADTANVPDIPGVPSLQGLLNSGPLVPPPDPDTEREQRRSEQPPAPPATRNKPAQQVQVGPDDWDDDWEWNAAPRGGRR